jgi:hypothetical protein
MAGRSYTINVCEPGLLRHPSQHNCCLLSCIRDSKDFRLRVNGSWLSDFPNLVTTLQDTIEPYKTQLTLGNFRPTLAALEVGVRGISLEYVNITISIQR